MLNLTIQEVLPTAPFCVLPAALCAGAACCLLPCALPAALRAGALPAVVEWLYVLFFC